MSFHPRLVLIPMVLAVAACDLHEEGPRETREGVFVFAAPAAAGSAVMVRTGRGNVTVEPSADDTLRVRGDVSWSGMGEPMSGLEISGRAIPEGILICAIWGNTVCNATTYTAQMGGSARRKRVSFVVQVPTGVKLDLITIDGDIRSASSAPVTARSVNGDVTVVTARGPVNAQTVNGSVDARMTLLDGADSVIAKTLNGDAWVFLPEQVQATVDVAVSNGRLVTDFPSLLQLAQGTRHLQATLGEGTTPVLVKTLNGRAGVRRLDAAGRAYELNEP